MRMSSIEEEEEETEGVNKDFKRGGSSSILILSSHVSSTIFRCFVPETTATQNANFVCVRRERKKVN